MHGTFHKQLQINDKLHIELNKKFKQKSIFCKTYIIYIRIFNLMYYLQFSKKYIIIIIINHDNCNA